MEYKSYVSEKQNILPLESIGLREAKHNWEETNDLYFSHGKCVVHIDIQIAVSHTCI
jgi:hypothetical protein